MSLSTEETNKILNTLVVCNNIISSQDTVLNSIRELVFETCKDRLLKIQILKLIDENRKERRNNG